MKTLIIALFTVFAFTLSAQTEQPATEPQAVTTVAPQPALDTNLVKLINEFITQLDQTITKGQEIVQDNPGAPTSPENVSWWQSLIYIFSTVLLPYLLRRLANGSQAEQVIGFLGKIKDNGLLAIVSAGIVVIVGLVGFQGEADTLTLNEIITYFTSVFGTATIFYILTKFFTGGKSKTPEAKS